MANNSKGVVAGILVVLGLIGYACGHNDPSAPSFSASGQTLTVMSVQTFADITLSDGRRVHNSLVDSVAYSLVSSGYGVSSSADDAQKTCITQALNRFALDNLVGREVTDVQEDAYPSSYSVAPLTGYTRARVYFVDGASRYGDVSSALNTVSSNAWGGCYSSAHSSPISTPAPPTTTSTAEPPAYATPDVYVDAPDHDAPKRHTGHSGHPCLPGERDGDGDGYCGEGR